MEYKLMGFDDPIMTNSVKITTIGPDIIHLETARLNKDGTPYFPLGEASFFFDSLSSYLYRISFGLRANKGELSRDKDGDIIKFDKCRLFLPKDDPLGHLVVQGQDSELAFDGIGKNSGELPPFDKTPEIFPLWDQPRVLFDLSRSDGRFLGVEENSPGLYLLLCDKDPIKLRKLYLSLTGRPGLVRFKNLGVWNSKYYPYSDKQALALIDEYRNRGIYLDNLVIDTDWRKASDRGIGYEVNEELFPSLSDFFNKAHEAGVEVMFNDHPEPLEKASSCLDIKEMEYREEKLGNILDQGLDTWWYDRNWITSLKSPHKDIRPETLGAFIFTEITRKRGHHGRPVVMSNVNEVSNGRYMGIMDSAYHRYPFSWTGDIGSGMENLAQEVENLIRCENNLILFANCDLGGHTGNPNKEEYLRWIQFGALSPIFRPHCTISVARTREPWLYDEETVALFKEWTRLRYRLLPYLYSNFHVASLEGLPPYLASNALDGEEDYDPSGFYIGPSLYFSPVAMTGKMERLAESNYRDKVRFSYFKEGVYEGSPIDTAIQDKIDFFYDKQGPSKKVGLEHYSAKIETKVYFDKDVIFFLRSDDGCALYLDGKEIYRDDSYHAANLLRIGKIEGGKTHDLAIHYFNGEGNAVLEAYYKETNSELDKNYLVPRGHLWYDLFRGNTYEGGWRKEVWSYKEAPLFAKGIVVTSKLKSPLNKPKYGSITLHVFPGEDAKFRLYEDDGESLDYLNPALVRVQDFESISRQDMSKMEVRISPATYGSKPSRGTRNILFKLYLPKGLEPTGLKLDGEDIPFRVIKPSRMRPILSDSIGDHAFRTLNASLKADMGQGHLLEVSLKRNQ